MQRENVLREVLAQYENQRLENHREEERRRAEVAEKSPRIAALLKEREEGFYARMRAAFRSPQNAQQTAEQLEADLKRINAALREALVKLGYDEEYLQPVYRCKLCRDTGYVGEPIHEQCACLRRRVLEGMLRDENLRGLERENFATYDASVYPDTVVPEIGRTQRAYMERVRAVCERYANNFPKNEKPNLLFCGKSGLGKTFLMNCIAERVLERGYGVMRLTAYRLIEIMRRYHYNGEDAQLVEEMRGCDLLLLDDLGAEPMIENVTINYLYYLINERLCAGKAIIVSTNFMPDELREAYTERVSSRLMDQRNTQVLHFVGTDVRR